MIINALKHKRATMPNMFWTLGYTEAFMRPMRLAKREITDQSEIRSIVENAQVLHIGAIDAEGMFIVPMNYGYVWDDGADTPTFYLHSAREGRKAEAFCAGGATGVKVALELEEDRGNISGSYACAYSRSFRSIMGEGLVFPVEDAAERVRALEILMAHTAPEAPAPSFAPEAVERVAIFRIDVIHLTAKERAPKE